MEILNTEILKSPQDWMDMEFVTSARVVCLSRSELAALPHVRDLISSCLAPPKSWTAAAAIRRRWTHLARHLLDDLETNPELHYLTKRSRARRLLSEAASVGDLALMEHLAERFGCCVDLSAVTAAARGGHLEALQWLYDRVLASLAPNEDVEGFTKKVLPDNLMGLAGSVGNVEMLQWLHATTGGVLVFPALLGAARYGRLHVVEWAIPMLSTPVSFMIKWHLTEVVVHGGSLDVAMLALSKSMLLLAPDLMDKAASKRGGLEMLQWMYDSGGDGCTARGINDAARKGHLETVQWLHSKGLRCSSLAMDDAAGNGHLVVVEFLREHCSIEITPDAFRCAVNHGHLDVARYLLEHRRGDCTAAVLLDHVACDGGLEMIQWLRTTGVTTECRVNAMDGAAANGHLEVVQFLHTNRSEGCTTGAMDGAAANGHLEVVKFLHEHRSEGCTTSAMDQAAAMGHLDVVKWLHFNRTEGCTTDAMLHASRHGHLEIIKFLHAHRPEGCTTIAMDCAGSLDVLRWLGDNRREGFTQRALLNAVAVGDLEMLRWLHKRAPAEMWTPTLANTMASHGQIEMLQWLADTFPGLVDALALPPTRTPALWWITRWSTHRIET